MFRGLSKSLKIPSSFAAAYGSFSPWSQKMIMRVSMSHSLLNASTLDPEFAQKKSKHRERMNDATTALQNKANW